MTNSAPGTANYGTNSGPKATEVWGEDQSVYEKLQNQIDPKVYIEIVTVTGKNVCHEQGQLYIHTRVCTVQNIEENIDGCISKNSNSAVLQGKFC